ncbi:hypothetical protein L1987_28475 [Smallanthus sonchifolius]|uniref:Uncharacterized protein n=1 Tax=Smallanthus sonchifolius TaxID=185202 RepID=A0ACB9HXB3_9ASTR|nr:hypothetical protein L1987_28475 [Smallanthus sonchifolius]
MSSTQSLHSLAFRVMRLCRPTFHVETPLQFDLCDLVVGEDLFDSPSAAPRHLLQSHSASRESSSANLSYRNRFVLSDDSDAMGVPGLLVLPQSFGAIYLGETFCSYISINNSSNFDVRDIIIKSEIQTERQRIMLLDTSKSPVESIRAGGRYDFIVEHDVKELGAHTLVCTALYHDNDAERKYLPQYFKFMVSNPLSVRTKVRVVKDTTYLETCLENNTKSNLLMDQVEFAPAPRWSATILKADVHHSKKGGFTREIFKPPVLIRAGGGIYNYLYALKMSSAPTKGEGSNVLGKLQITWRANLGEPGRLQTQQIVGNVNDAADPSTPKPLALHPAYSVTNINAKIRTLDGTNVTYSNWVKLFNLHVTAYKVANHIDGSPPPEKTAPEYELWKEIDALVMQWIFSTVSDDILKRIINTNASACDTWVKLEKIYLSNKKARAAALETKFCNMTLGACASLEAYCQELQCLATQLADVDEPVSDSRLVLQLVRGLPPEYNTTASFINNKEADWDLAISLLKDDAIRIEAQKGAATSVLVAPTTTTPSTPQPALTTTSSDHPSEHNSNNQTRGRGRGRSRNGYRGGNRYNNRGGSSGGRSFWTAGNPSAYNSPYPNWAWLGEVHLSLTNLTGKKLGPFEVWLSLSDSKEEKAVMISGLQRMDLPGVEAFASLEFQLNLISAKLGVQKITGITVFDTMEKKTYDPLPDLDVNICRFRSISYQHLLSFVLSDNND